MFVVSGTLSLLTTLPVLFLEKPYDGIEESDISSVKCRFQRMSLLCWERLGGDTDKEKQRWQEESKLEWGREWCQESMKTIKWVFGSSPLKRTYCTSLETFISFHQWDNVTHHFHIFYTTVFLLAFGKENVIFTHMFLLSFHKTNQQILMQSHPPYTHQRRLLTH